MGLNINILDEVNEFTYDILLAHRITDSGVPNIHGCRIPVKSKWNVNMFGTLLHKYDDTEILQWLTYGFSISRNDQEPDPWPAQDNHAGANNYPETIDKYIEDELRFGATMGPFRVPPFIHRIGISPLSTRPKKNSSKRRIIMDLSFPENHAVNMGISATSYCGEEVKLTYPTIDILAKRIHDLGEYCLLWKVDLFRYFRQIPLCPREYSLIGYRWRNMLYFDKFVPMGLRSASYIAQRLSNGIVFAHRTFGYWSINYLDDFGSAETKENAQSSYLLLKRILKSIGVDESVEKAVEPTTRMDFLGNLLDTVSMTIEVTPERIAELEELFIIWEKKTTFSKKQLQSLIGKLSFITNCVRASRVFMCRLLQQLRNCRENGNPIQSELLKDIAWWKCFLPTFNGVLILWLLDLHPIDELLASDASLIGGGAVHKNEFVHFKFHPEILESTSNIAQREMYTIMVAMKLWGHKLAGNVVRFYTDNQNCLFAINSGDSRDCFMLKCLREIIWITAKLQILLRAKFIGSKQNVLPDALSRWYIDSNACRTVKRIINKDWTRKSVSTQELSFHCIW